ncbi:SURF1 family protein [Streptomyces globisporus]|uniref:SURF1 family protein n=1 Tax=Streptomyces TaxID=1883 RepID=UPI000E2CEE42|nr:MULTISPECIES: SURF1 family protein [unclassified Streptomyces]RDL09731.1 cytochrome oxidase assembly protein ShyY1 [Streptomyces sp. HB202]UIZ14399.1 SURF1 family protein [Streptomyces sp. R527F]WSF77528.1 SURF1 family protein [Streptomyces globisporus]
MYRFLLTPRWWGINLFVVLAIPFCVFMGTWQLGRFEDRVQSHEQAEKAPDPSTRAAKPLDALLPVDKVTSGRPAIATGTYADQFLVPGRKLEDRQGFYVLNMLRTDSGKALPVVRGWLPGSATDARVPAAPKGEVTVTGDLQASENTHSDGVDVRGGLPSGQVGMISAATLVNLVPYDVYDAWVTLPEAEAGGTGGAMKPVPAAAPEGSGLDLKAFQNLGYTGEWFVFAAFVLFMWFRLVRREAEAERDIALGLVPEESPAPATADAPEGAGPAVEGAEAPETAEGAPKDAPEDPSSPDYDVASTPVR